MNWGEFRKLTADIPDSEEMHLELNGKLLKVNKQETEYNFTNNNTIVLEHKSASEFEKLVERWAGTLF